LRSRLTPPLLRARFARAQYSTPAPALPRLLSAIQNQPTNRFSDLPLEIKFLRGSGDTAGAPNSGWPGQSVACVNAWWQMADAGELTRDLERLCSAHGGGRFHLGKWHRPSIPPPALPPPPARDVALSVILPVYNALPYLGHAVRDSLRSVPPDGGRLEIVVSDDCR
jgi:hypothetical protein